MSAADALQIAETFLQEMFQADDSADFALYTKRYEAKYLEGFSAEQFHGDIRGMQERNGPNQGYEFFGTLRSAELDGHEVYRSVWKGIYEKRDAVVEMAVYQKAGEWHVIRSSVH